MLIGLFLVRLGPPLVSSGEHMKCSPLGKLAFAVIQEGAVSLSEIVQTSKGAYPMTLLGGSSSSHAFPSGRYTRTNPLRREFGLCLLAEELPEPLRTTLIRAWRRPVRYDGKQAVQSLYRQRPAEASFSLMSAALLGAISLTELEVSRRIVETPRTSISRETRSKLLRAQGAYLLCLYTALTAKLGEASALAEFERLTLKVG